MRRVAEVIQQSWVGHRLERCVQPDGERVVLSLYGRTANADTTGHSSQKAFLLLCSQPDTARASEVDRLPKAPQNPPAFVSWLRAHMKGARLTSSSLISEDRLLSLGFETREGGYRLILALLGARTNLYVINEEGRVVALLRPANQTRSELGMGDLFTPPASGVPGHGKDRFADESDEDLLVAIEKHYSDQESVGEETTLVRNMRQTLKRERKNAARRLEKIEAELAEADDAPELQRHGDLLKSALSQVGAGDTEVRVHDYETGEEVVIPLDPKLDARENMEAIFKRYKKLLRRLSRAGGQVDEARSTLERLIGFEEALEAIAGPDTPLDSRALEELAAEPEMLRLLGRRKAASRKASGSSPPKAEVPKRFRKFERRLHPRRYRSRDGLEIWVGRSDHGNDALSTRIARGSDLFFHLDGAPGSHVVLCTDGQSDPPQESILDACELAVHFSKQKNASRADVHVVPIKQVKKPKGAKPGLVWVTGGRSLHLRREETRLARLLDSQIES